MDLGKECQETGVRCGPEAQAVPAAGSPRLLSSQQGDPVQVPDLKLQT